MREPAEGLDQGSERQPIHADVDTAAIEHPVTRRAGVVEDLVKEPGLADAGLAGDEDESRATIARPRQGRRDEIEFALTADQRRAGKAHPHEDIVVPLPRGLASRATDAPRETRNAQGAARCAVGSLGWRLIWSREPAG